MEASERFTNERTILSTCAHELHRLRASTSTPACPKRQESERQRTILKFDSLPTGGREGRLQKGGRPQARVGWVGVDILFFEDLYFLLRPAFLVRSLLDQLQANSQDVPRRDGDLRCASYGLHLQFLSFC